MFYTKFQELFYLQLCWKISAPAPFLSYEVIGSQNAGHSAISGITSNPIILDFTIISEILVFSTKALYNLYRYLNILYDARDERSFAGFERLLST